MLRIEVECEGTAAHSPIVPLSFRLGSRRYQVAEIVDRWSGPEQSYLRVRADDGGLFVLRHDEATHQWELAAYTSAARAQGEMPAEDAGAGPQADTHPH